MNMKHLIAVMLLATANLCHAAEAIKLDEKTVTAALKAHLQANGYFCLGKTSWPIYVSERDYQHKTSNALQLPVLQRHDLVASTMENIQLKTEDSEEVVQAARYELTPAGKKFYLDRSAARKAGAPQGEVRRDFCVGKLSLVKVLKWEQSKLGDGQGIVVSYTYRIDAPEWAYAQDVQEVFPLLAQIVNGQGKAIQKQPFNIVNGKLEPVTRL